MLLLLLLESSRSDGHVVVELSGALVLLGLVLTFLRGTLIV
jgi:hypothetical protein